MAGGEGGLGFSTTAAAPLPIPCTAKMPALPPAGLPVVRHLSWFPSSGHTHSCRLPFHSMALPTTSSQPSFTSPGGLRTLSRTPGLASRALSICLLLPPQLASQHSQLQSVKLPAAPWLHPTLVCSCLCHSAYSPSDAASCRVCMITSFLSFKVKCKCIHSRGRSLRHLTPVAQRTRDCPHPELICSISLDIVRAPTFCLAWWLFPRKGVHLFSPPRQTLSP